MSSELKSRDQIPARFKWNLEALFPTEADWEAEMSEVQAQLPAVQAFQGTLAQGPATVARWLELAQKLERSMGRVYVYASCAHAVDTTDQRAAALQARAMTVAAQLQGAVAFAEPELLAIGPDTLKAWARENAELAIYAHYFEQLSRRAEHLRSAEVETLLGELRDPMGSAISIHGILANADLQFAPASAGPGTPDLPVVQGTYTALETHPNREVRRTAFESYADAHLAVKNTMAACLATGVKRDVFMARQHRYDSALEAAVSANFVPSTIFHNVVDTFRRNLPTWHRYWRVRRKAMGLDVLRPYDLQAPLTSTKPAVPFEQAIEWIMEGLAPLGKAYLDTARDGLLNRNWVDVYANKGKTAGAFSTGSVGTEPMILMSYSDDLFSLSTLAHELGHSMHSHLSWETQPVIYSDYSIFVAEVASNCNQALVRAHLLDTLTDRAYQIGLIEEALANYFRYFFLMPTLARFELETHQRVERGQALTADSLIDLMAELFAEAYGGEVEMDHDRVGITWAEFHTHLYYNFYVYQYTTGISAAHALARRIRTGGPAAAEDYLAGLKSGGSLFPLDALRLAGVDMESPEPIQVAFDDLASLVDRLDGLLNG
ncbi:MAG: oligoendopeptidase F [Anaerolineae bacterium]|jgi:oligoendopeptidase F|nr:oligoendopeptidase F [Chloroflexota bacterium]